MDTVTKQMKEWMGNVGKEYTDMNLHTTQERNEWYKKYFGTTRSEMEREFLGDLPKSLRILEVGANVGISLNFLQELGFTNLYGIELQDYAIEISKGRTKNINIIKGSGLDIPFKDGYFDLVFTSGVLIHISPDDIGRVISEMHRCSKQYLWGFEYFAEKYTPLQFWGASNLEWKTDFAKLFLDTCPGMELVKEKRYKFLDQPNETKYKDCVNTMYLLKKVK